MSQSDARPLVFDLDGTLIDSRGDIAAACNHALHSAGLPSLSVSQISAHVGNGARALLHGVLAELTDLPPALDERSLFAAFQSYYLENPVGHNVLMPGADAALALRAQRAVALCTNKPAHLTQAVLRSLGWLDRFDSVVAPGISDPVKPDPTLLLRVASELSVAPSSLIMIGDGPQDIGAGRAVGAHTIGLKGGFLPLSWLIDAKPDVILDSLHDLPAHLYSLDAPTE
jgi:phosphoglycolate phosphatase